MCNCNEFWEPLPGFRGEYAVGSLGHVRSVPRKVPCPGNGVRRVQGGPLKAGFDGKYLFVQLTRNGKTLTRSVHSLVALAFLGPRPEGKQVNHKDGLKLHNCVCNLEYVTPSENTQHGYDLGLAARGEQHYNAVLSAQDVREIRRRKGATSKRKLAVEFGVHPSTVAGIWARREWAHLDG